MNFTFLIIMCLLGIHNISANDAIIIDSDMSFEEAIRGTTAPKEIIDSLTLLNVTYYSTDGKLHQGQLVVHKSLAGDIKEIFKLIKEIKFPVAKVIPIVRYNWSDEKSMDDNNTSSFNYRTIAGTTRLSLHSYGKAIDINPFFNPVVYNDGKRTPSNAQRDTSKPGTFTENHPVVQKFLRLGWRWGGHFNQYKDFHHFDKP